MRLLILDIETAPATALVWGIHKQHLGAHQIVEPVRMLCFAAKWYDSKKVYYASEHHNSREEMLLLLWDLLHEADAVIHYNGASFDVPIINREFLLAGFNPPSPFAQIDLWKSVRSKFRFMSNKLDSVAGELGIGHKIPHEGFDLWKKCLADDEKAWGRMKRYNIQDVRLTEKLYTRLRPWIKGHPSVTLVLGGTHNCPTCGSAKVQKRGFARTAMSTFQQYQCNDCGSYSRSGKRLDGVDLRGV